MNENDTICAISTAAGMGAVAIIRLSGSKAIASCDSVFRATSKNKKLVEQPANTIHHGWLYDGDQALDEVLVSVFRAPRTYTGEDVIEITCHGSPYIQQQIVRVFINQGIRHAKAGEFTMRAFLNGKMDLSQTEAVADLIAAESAGAHKLALQQMKGGYSKQINDLRDQLLHFISLIELELDFADEDVEFADRSQLSKLVNTILATIKSLVDSFAMGNVIKNGIPVAIAGKPNVGKSTLLNVLLNEDKAIVSDIPGTTRDTIEDLIHINGILFRFIDTAGIRHTDDIIENLGIERTMRAINQAQVVLWVKDARLSDTEIQNELNEIKQVVSSQEVIVIFNKIDQLSEASCFTKLEANNDFPSVYVSAKKSENIHSLIDLLSEITNKFHVHSNSIVVTNIRHYEALSHAHEALLRVTRELQAHTSQDFIAQDIREAIYYLGEITGVITTDEVLGNIFGKFCIGK